jgi:hypothetical protein
MVPEGGECVDGDGRGEHQNRNSCVSFAWFLSARSNSPSGGSLNRPNHFSGKPAVVLYHQPEKGTSNNSTYRP